jgi:hypothetical protein
MIGISKEPVSTSVTRRWYVASRPFLHILGKDDDKESSKKLGANSNPRELTVRLTLLLHDSAMK